MANPVPAEKKLPYVLLGQTGIKVSNMCLGGLTFGESIFGLPDQADEDLAHQIINRYVEWGGNFIDTADVYGRGNSETIIGKWLERQTREDFVINTKVRMNMNTEETENKVNNVGLSRRHITESIDKSLQRLKTNFIDIYQAHIFDYGTRLEETFRTFDDLIRCGKVRYIGVSNFSGWQLQKAVDLTEKLGLNPIATLQQQYNLVSRESEWEPFQVCKNAGIGVLIWSPLKGGLLTGNVNRGEKPTEGRLAWVADDAKRATEAFPFWKTLDDKTFDIIEVVKAIAKKKERSPAQIALRWLLQRDIVSSVIIGADNLSQLDENLDAGNGWSLSKEEMQQLDEISNPKLPYPYEMIFGFNTDRQNRQTINHYVQPLSN